MDLGKLGKKITMMHLVIAVAILVGLYFMGVLQFFMGAVVADIEVESALCRIPGETWSPETLKCQCQPGYGYSFTSPEAVPETFEEAAIIQTGWNCVPLAAEPTATAEKPAGAPVEESIYTAKNVTLGIAIIAGAIVLALVIRKKKK